jgi:hypothetical protein
MPKLVMMFRTLRPTLASTFWVGRLRARRLRPISVLYQGPMRVTHAGDSPERRNMIHPGDPDEEDRHGRPGSARRHDSSILAA